MKISITLCIRSALCSAWFRLRGVHSSLVACDGRIPVLYTGGTIEIGKRPIIRGRILRSELGASRPGSVLKIGNGVLINQGVSLVATSYIEIGDDAAIGNFVTILDTDYHRIEPGAPIRTEPVIIGANVWLGESVKVLPGSKIGDHSVVAAGSIVRGDVPPRVLVAGSPAKVIKTLDVPDGWRRG
jgi:acetyltransferase-like isoleucine patch superfamily enzyme